MISKSASSARPAARRRDPRSGEPAATPMIAQYRRIKQAHPDCLLFFRMGDFYELFFEDAKIAARCLDIALTRRGRYAGEDIPMCGVPVHSAEQYLARLIRAGHRVAICEQLEEPGPARRRGLLAREVVRIVTPGTLTESGLLDAQRHNYLAALACDGAHLALAWVDISTGLFRTQLLDHAADLPEALARIDPRELLVPEPLVDRLDLQGPGAEWRERIVAKEGVCFDPSEGERLLCRHFRLATLEGLGRFEAAELGAAGALLAYLQLTQKGLLPRLERPLRVDAKRVLRIDPATRRSLELLADVRGERAGSLLGAVDRTLTAAGARLLAEWLGAPLADLERIRSRHDRVQAFLDRPDLRREVRARLRGLPDLSRALSRLVLERGGPRDLQAVGRGLEVAEAVAGLLAEAEPPLRTLGAALADPDRVGARIRAALVDQPPTLAREGGFIRPGFDAELDRLRALRDQGRRHMAALEARLREQTRIPSLKVRHNHLLGYFIEVTAAHRDKVPDHFVPRQGMAQATRYVTAELTALERELTGAAERALLRELALFAELREQVSAQAEAIARTAQALARIDVAAGLAELAAEWRYVRPRMVEEPCFRVRGGRHPVVEQALARQGERFVANDLHLDRDGRLWLLTGPNMAGKSTFLRQNALILVLAQAGSFVPAEEAEIGLADRLFSRVGAADDLARGRSTFMVEMVETAAILNQATPASFVLLDEIGRGTATYDGLALAWAVVEHLHEVVRCRGLFATHYHELTALAGRLPALAAHTVRVKEWRGRVVFLHEVVPGCADRSYGIQVAELAGLPPAVVARAREVLRRLEAAESRSPVAALVEDLPLFQALARSRASPPPHPSPVEERLAAVDPDGITPRQALALLYELKALLERDRPPQK